MQSPTPDPKPLSEAKARLLEHAAALARLTATISDLLDDHAISDATCKELDEQILPLIERTTALEAQAERECLAAAPQANASGTVRSAEQQSNGLGVLASLPTELRSRIGSLLPPMTCCSLASTSRAVNVEILQRLMTDVILQEPVHDVARQRSFNNVVTRLAGLGQLYVKKLHVRGEDIGYGRVILPKMAPSVQHLTITSSLNYSTPTALQDRQQLYAVAMPRLHTLELNLTVYHESEDLGELHIDLHNPFGSGEDSEDDLFIDDFIPAETSLRHLSLALTLANPDLSPGADFGEFRDTLIVVPLSIDVLRAHTELKSLRIGSQVRNAGKATPALLFTLADYAVPPPTFAALRTLSLLDQGTQMSLSTAEMRDIARMVPNIIHLCLDVKRVEDETHPTPLPPLAAVRHLCIRGEWVPDLFKAVQLDKLQSFNLRSAPEDWEAQLPSLATIQGAISLDLLLPNNFYEAVNLASFATCRLAIAGLNTYIERWRPMRADVLPQGLETLHVLNLPYDPLSSVRKTLLNDLFVRLPTLSLIILAPNYGSLVRLPTPDAEGLSFRHTNEKHDDTKAFNKMFGSYRTYLENWWEE